MPDPREDVLNKMDALLKKHHATEPDIPVLTDIVEPPRINLDLIPVLTEEVHLTAPADTPPPVTPVDTAPRHPAQTPTAPTELDKVHALPPAALDANSVLQRLEAVEAEVQAEIDARISRAQSTPNQRSSIEIPPNAHFISLTPGSPIAPTPPAETIEPKQEPKDSAKQIIAIIETDISRIIKKHLHQSLDEELTGMLSNALDKALSSMLEQFVLHMEEVVRHSIADELKKQLAPFKRPTPPPKS